MKTKEEILKGCEHDGSFIPVSEVKRLMSEVEQQTRDEMLLFAKHCIINVHEGKINGYTDISDILSDAEIDFDSIQELFEYWQLNIKEKNEI